MRQKIESHFYFALSGNFLGIKFGNNVYLWVQNCIDIQLMQYIWLPIINVIYILYVMKLFTNVFRGYCWSVEKSRISWLLLYQTKCVNQVTDLTPSRADNLSDYMLSRVAIHSPHSTDIVVTLAVSAHTLHIRSTHYTLLFGYVLRFALCVLLHRVQSWPRRRNSALRALYAAVFVQRSTEIALPTSRGVPFENIWRARVEQIELFYLNN